MARSFNGTSDRLEIDATPPVTAAPLTLACWAYRSSDATQVALGLFRSTTSSNYFWIGSFTSLGNGYVSAYTGDAGISDSATTSGFTSNTWHHICGVFSSTTARRSYIDGTTSGDSTVSVTPAGVNRISIGRFGGLGGGNYWMGYLAEAAIWNIALSADDISTLSKAVSPLLVRPDALLTYWPIIGRYSPETSIFKGGYDLTVTGSPVYDHPRIFYPPRARGGRFAAAVGGGGGGGSASGAFLAMFAGSS